MKIWHYSDGKIVRNSFDRNKTSEFAVSEPDEYKVGDYVDMVFIKTGIYRKFLFQKIKKAEEAKKMETSKQAIIRDGVIICPLCYKKNGELTGNEEIHNFKIRCRGSSGRLEHFFVLNVEREVKNI